jgi:hypothetical protein
MQRVSVFGDEYAKLANDVAGAALMGRGIDSADHCAAATAALCPCDPSSVKTAAVCSDKFLQIVLSIFRFVGAAYVTGASDCWEAAYRLADDTIEIADGPLLVTRVAALVRIFRTNGARDPVYLPPRCKRLSKDETRLMRILEAARSGATNEWTIDLAGFVPAGREPSTREAIEALVALSPGLGRQPEATIVPGLSGEAMVTGLA